MVSFVMMQKLTYKAYTHYSKAWIQSANVGIVSYSILLNIIMWVFVKMAKRKELSSAAKEDIIKKAKYGQFT